jgi:hypothetical protein
MVVPSWLPGPAATFPEQTGHYPLVPRWLDGIRILTPLECNWHLMLHLVPRRPQIRFAYTTYTRRDTTDSATLFPRFTRVPTLSLKTLTLQQRNRAE